MNYTQYILSLSTIMNILLLLCIMIYCDTLYCYTPISHNTFLLLFFPRFKCKKLDFLSVLRFWAPMCDCVAVSPDLHTFQELVNTAFVLQTHYHSIGWHHSQVAALVLEQVRFSPVRTQELQVFQLQVQRPGLLVLALHE